VRCVYQLHTTGGVVFGLRDRWRQPHGSCARFAILPDGSQYLLFAENRKRQPDSELFAEYLQETTGVCFEIRCVGWRVTWARRRADDPDGLSESELAELKRLRREVVELRTDREILRKAAAFFARETTR